MKLNLVKLNLVKLNLMKLNLVKPNLIVALLFAANATSLFAQTTFDQTTFDFEALPIPASGFYQGDVSATGPERGLYTVESSAPSPFGVGDQFIQRLTVEENGQTVSFSNSFENGFNSFSGFAISNVSDTTTPGFGNQFASFPGSGSGGSANYLISNGSGANLAASLLIDSIDITNTTYVALAVRGDDGNTPAFVSGPLEDSEGFFELTIQGNNAAASQQQIVVDLADFRDGNSTLIDAWQTLDVSVLESTELTFSYDGSDVNPTFGGLNTPLYFALDNVTLSAVAVPEPSSLLLIGLGLSGAFLRRRR